MPDDFEFQAVSGQSQQATIVQPAPDDAIGITIKTWQSLNTGSASAAILATPATGGTENYGLLTSNIGLNSLTNSGILKLVPSDTATDFTLTFPAITDSLLANTNTATLTNKTISATYNTISSLTNTNLSGTAGITNANLANSTISGVALGSSLYGLSATSGLSGTTYDGSATSSFSLNMGNANSWTADQSFVNVNISGTLTTTGTTVYINSTVTTIKDPVITLGGLNGGGALVANDSKDRGIEFQWYDSAAKKGFFGFRRSNQRLAFIPDGTNTSEVYAGTLGDIEATTFYGALSGNATSATTAAGLSSTLAIASGGTNATTASAARTSLGLAIGSDVQAWDGDLDAIAALTATTGFLKKTAADTWALDTGSYLSGNQTITVSGDASGSGTTAITLTLATVPIAKGGTGATTAAAAITALTGTQTAGRYLRSDGTNAALAAIQAADVPTLNQNTTGTAAGLSSTLAIASGGTNATTASAARTSLGLAIGSDVQAWDGDLDAIAALTATTGFLKKTAADTWALDTGSYLSGNQTITVSGDASGSGTTAITLTLATVPIGKGGTGATTAAAAITALTGTQTAGRYLRSDGTNAALAAIQAADVPTLNQNTTGTAAGLSSTLAIASGGTNATTASAARTSLGLAIGSDVQAWDGDLDAIAALTATTGFLKKTAADTWALDTGSYLSGNQTITVSGDASGSGTTAITLTLATVPIAKGGTGATTAAAAITALTGTQTAGRYLRSDGTNAALGTIQAADVPTLNQNTTGTAAGLSSTLAIASGGTNATTASAARTSLGLAIGSDVQAWDGDLDAIAALTATTGFLKKTAANTWALDTGSYLSGNQTITVSGDASGSGTTAITLTLATVPIAKGGTGATTAAAAITALTGTQTAGRYLRSDGTNAALGTIQAADVPTLNQNTTGTAAGLSSTLAIASGGTNATTASDARTSLGLAIGSNVQAWDGDLDAIAALTATTGFLKKTAADTWALDTGSYLSGNQTITVSGDASGSGTTTITLTLATVPIAKGGTGATTAAAAITALTGTQTAGRYLRSDGTNAALATIQAADVPTLNQNTTGTAAGLSSTLAIASGGTNATTASAARTSLGLAIGSDVQAWDGDLDAIAALTATTGFLKKTAANTWQLDASVSGSGTTTNALTIGTGLSGTSFDGSSAVTIALASSGVTAATYRSVTVDATGRVTAGSSPTTLAGYGITDAQPLDADLSSIAAIADGATGFLKKTGANAWATDTSSYLTANQTITLTGDVTGSGSTSIASTLATISGVAGSYINANITVDTKGRITAAASGSSGATSAQTKTYTLTGTVTAAAGTVRWYPDATITLTGAYSITSTTPSGGAFAITIRKNGISIGTLSVAAGSYRSTLATLAVSLLATDYVTIDVDTSNGAANANICILYTR